jgi:hypothetical protein
VERRRIRDAVDAHRNTVQRAISCVTPATIVIRRSFGNDPDLRPVVLNNGLPVPIDSRLSITASQIVDTNALVDSDRQHSTVYVVGYHYTMLDRSGIEIVSYQWHPHAPGGIDVPHVHFGPASARPDSSLRPGELHKVHFPTGFVALEDIIRLAIVEFGAEPRRSDWRDILSQ